jgi:acetyl esterase/lipase
VSRNVAHESRPCRAAVVIIAVVLLCAAASAIDTSGVTLERDIVYARRPGLDLKVDVAFLAGGLQKVPAIIFIPGNGWGWWWDQTMDRRQCSWALPGVVAKGYVAVSIDHSPSSQLDAGKARFPFPAQVSDVKNAIRWVRAHAEQYGIDESRIGVIGFSSGGHLATLAGLTCPDDGMDGEVLYPGYSANVQAVVSLGAPMNLERSYRESVGQRDPDLRQNVSILELFLGGSLEQVPDMFRRANPAAYVRPDSPPILSIYGVNDDPQRGEELDARMKEVGVEHTLKVIKGMGHEFRWYDPDIWRFLDRVLKSVKP